MIAKLTSLLSLMLLCNLTYAQLTITEISYNPPEGGTDSLEYIEVVNTTNAPVSLKDYKFNKGITYTFPDSILGTGKYFLIVKNARAFKTVYNITASDWSPTDAVSTANTLSNPGEILEIVDPLAKVIVSFKYERVAPWPVMADGTDGNGKSIELCKLTSDPALGSNWKVSLNDLLFMHNGKAVFGTPGKANSLTVCIVVPDTIVEVSSFKFTPKDLVIKVGETVRWKNIGGTHNVNGKIETFPSNPESFYSGVAAAGFEYDFTFTKPGLYNYHCDPHSSQMKGTVTVLDPNPPVSYPSRTIALMTTTNTDGVLDSLNKNCTLTGVVYGVNLRPTGLQFTIIDQNNNGVGVFNNNSNVGYTVKEGDNISVQGSVGQFNGFAQVTATGIVKNSENNNLVNPKTITSFVENDESSLVRISNLTFVDPTQWMTGVGAGFNVSMTNGTTTFAIRIDNDVDAYALPVPVGTFNVTGLLGQFDASAPHNEGYQLIPRYIVDFSPAGSSVDPTLDHLVVSPNPTNDIITIHALTIPNQVEIFSVDGKKLATFNNTNQIKMGTLDKGLYVLKMNFNNKIISRKVWKF